MAVLEEDKQFLRTMRNWILGTFFGIAVIVGLAALASAAFSLAWFPWQVQMQTGMIRNSNSYLTTQQTALRNFRIDYELASTNEQRAAIVNQMHQIADLIPGEVPSDIQLFLTSH
jgi:hypothetical protein